MRTDRKLVNKGFIDQIDTNVGSIHFEYQFKIFWLNTVLCLLTEYYLLSMQSRGWIG